MLAWFLGCLDRTIEDADHAVGSVLHKAKLWQRINLRPVNERQRRVTNRMLDDFQGHLTTSNYAKLGKCSNDTVLRDIRDLLERDILVKNPSGGRSTSYRLIDPNEVSTARIETRHANSVLDHNGRTPASQRSHGACYRFAVTNWK